MRRWTKRANGQMVCTTPGGGFISTPKTTWPDCQHPECPDPQQGRAVGPGAVTPTRVSGRNVGFEGVLCADCYMCARAEGRFLAEGRVSKRVSRWWGRKLGLREPAQLALPGFRRLVA